MGTARVMNFEGVFFLTVETLLKIQYDLAVDLCSTSDLIQALNLILDAALKIEGVDCGGIYLVDEVNKDLKFMVHKGLSEAAIKKASPFSFDSPQAHILLAGKPFYINFPDLPGSTDEIFKVEELHAIAMIPVVYEKKVIALVIVSSHTYNEIAIDSRKALESIAAQLGHAIARITATEKLRENQEDRRNNRSVSPLYRTYFI